MHVLVTGGAGYIGSHACKALAEAGFVPVAYDNMSKGRAGAVQWGPLEIGDLADRARLDAVLATYTPVAVMHFAAAIEVGESVTEPGKYWRNNFIGSLTLAEAVVAAKCLNLVFSSTCAVYNGNTVDDLTEESPFGPINAYGGSKRATEMMLTDFGAAHGLQTIIFRYFNVAGAAPGAGIGQSHADPTHIIPRLLIALEGGTGHMTINGDDYPTPDGTCVRDYIHVMDLVEAHIAGLKRLLDGGKGGAYNLGTGQGASVREVIEAAAGVVGHMPQIQIGPRRPGDAVRLVSGSAKAHRDLGWVPQSSDLGTILDRFLDLAQKPGVAGMNATPKVLAVDLDGTLIASDMLHESFWATLGRDRGAVLKAGAKFLTGGRAALKEGLAAGGEVDVAHLPYKDVVLDEIRTAKEQGAHVVLATASDRSFAQAVADHLGLFDEVMASDGHVNLKGDAKTSALVEKFGAAGFSYLGDSAADLPVWAASGEAISVDAPAALKARIKAPEVRHLEGSTESHGIGPLLKALRPHQWLKNLLIFIPMLLAHDFSGSAVLAAIAAFVSFSLVASSVYVLNDLVDLSADRAHPRKRLRPFAIGALPLSVGLWLAPGLLVAGAVIGAFAGSLFLLVLLFYYLCTLSYSLVLKRITVIDICMLAGLYTLRVIAGAAATMNAPSVWLLGFSIFFFLALAAVKRQAELVDLVARGDEKAEGRGYLPDDLPLITMMALASGYVAVLVAGLYLTSDTVAQLYSFPPALWGICAVLVYWVSRIVMLTHRRRMHDDPIVFAVTDKVSLFCGVVIVGLVVLAARFSMGAS